MPPTIRVDDQIYQFLQERAVPFVDSPNDVLRRLLLDGAQPRPVQGDRRPGRQERVQLVLAKLAEHGYAGSAATNSDADIVARKNGVQSPVRIIVTTHRGSASSWMLTQKAERRVADDLFYVFVSMTADAGNPAFRVAASSVVANYVKSSHDKWLKTPGKKGQAHMDNPMRKFDDPEGKYLERWDYLDGQ